MSLFFVKNLNVSINGIFRYFWSLKVLTDIVNPMVIIETINNAREYIALYPPSLVIIKAATKGDNIHAIFIMVRYNPRIFPVCFGSPKCSTNMSMQKNINVFVAENKTKEAPIVYGFLEKINPSKDRMFKNKNPRVNFLLPKYFRMFTLFESKTRAKTEDIVYKIPTYFSETKFTRNEEFT